MKVLFVITLVIMVLLDPVFTFVAQSRGIHNLTYSIGNTTFLNGTSTLNSSNITSPLRNNVEHLAVRDGPPYCNPTGPGVCNMAFLNYVEAFGTSPNEGYVYDNYCNVIGFNDMGQGDFSIFSTLPYAVVGNGNQQSFCYAGKCYGDKCTSYYGNKMLTVFVKQCAFDC